MSDFNQDMENLLHAYDSNWQDYLILREQFIEKYSLSVEKLQEQLNTAKKALIEEIESIEKYLDKYGMSSYGANTRQAYLEGLKKALEALEGENND